MSSEHEPSGDSEKSKQPQYPVDLDELQARSELGERVDIMQAFRDSVDNDEVAGHHYGDKNFVRNKIAAGKFKETFSRAIGESPDLKTFVWRMDAAVHVTRGGLEHYRPKRPYTYSRPTVNQTLSDFAVPMGMQLLQFCERHPEATEQATAAWFESLLDSIEGPKTRHAKMSRIGTPLQKAATERHEELSAEKTSGDEKIVKDILNRIIWPEGVITQRSRNEQMILNDMETVNIANINSGNLEFLYTG